MLKLSDELRRRLFSDAGNAGNIVGRITHEGLHVDDLGRRVAVFRRHDVRRNGQHIRNTLFRQMDRDVFIDELQRVAVSRHDVDVKILRFHLPGNGADNVVAFIAFQLQDMNAQAFQYFPYQGELGPQIVGRRLARRLIAVVQVVSEGMLVLVKGYGYVMGLQLLVQFKQHVQKAVHGVRRPALAVRQGGDGVKGPV